MKNMMKANKFTPICVALFSATAALTPMALHAQADPMTPPASSTQPNMPNQRPAAATSMQDASGDSGATGQTMKDKMFLRHSAEGGIAEVQLGQLASQKASSEDVKAFGQKMVTDHTTLNNQMQSVADAMGVRLPKKMAKSDQAEYDKLSALSGSEFDTEYLTFMVRDHHKDLRAFREEAQSASDPALKDAVTKGEKVIEEHTMMVEKLATQKGVQLPGRKPAASATE